GAEQLDRNVGFIKLSEVGDRLDVAGEICRQRACQRRERPIARSGDQDAPTLRFRGDEACSDKGTLSRSRWTDQREESRRAAQLSPHQFDLGLTAKEVLRFRFGES